MRLKFYLPVILVLSCGAALGLMAWRYRRGNAVRASPLPEREESTGSLEYWLGEWQARVEEPRKSAELSEEESEALELARDVLARLIGEWALTPETVQIGAASPLKAMSPQVDVSRSRKDQEAWADELGNVWRASESQRRGELWIQTRVPSGPKDTLLAMRFRNLAGRDEGFDLEYTFSVDGGSSWIRVCEITYDRYGPLTSQQ